MIIIMVFWLCSQFWSMPDGFYRDMEIGQQEGRQIIIRTAPRRWQLGWKGAKIPRYLSSLSLSNNMMLLLLLLLLLLCYYATYDKELTALAFVAVAA